MKKTIKFEPEKFEPADNLLQFVDVDLLKSSKVREHLANRDLYGYEDDEDLEIDPDTLTINEKGGDTDEDLNRDIDASDSFTSSPIKEETKRTRQAKNSQNPNNGGDLET